MGRWESRDTTNHEIAWFWSFVLLHFIQRIADRNGVCYGRMPQITFN